MVIIMENNQKANALSVFQYNDVDVIESRQVAKMIEKTHAHLMRDIESYAKIISDSTESNFGLSDFFIESSYKDSTGRTLPCYLLTKKGCDMVANKTTGKKGVLFTAAYVTAFEEMRKNQELFNVPKDYPSALRALADAEEKKMLLAQQNAVMQPKAEPSTIVSTSTSGAKPLGSSTFRCREIRLKH